ncbi:MAG: endonuclease/exonuclease/phosphatase family protein [Phenylobacterium sp.]|uniref:endonuclease/exonuclease/phosphatase family protein n=1 Tax=Phenylobacterium sp. TaxID=1871053 RepID=UPI001A550AAF|nr:endonuclease/exonuclease/phosphatase family protein [Phenylobacterium sp.]MBL8555383.1 endonuclease/exonuclease/phosphatase family protein [Phenylobacterium sp.]
MNLLTWNIQACIGTSRYRDYLLRAYRQVMHTPAKAVVLEQIARTIAAYDVVCLQEVDLGGRRAAFRSQVGDIAAMSGHAHVAVQENRIVPAISRHGNAILSRAPLRAVRDVKLPGRLAGRGCLVADVEGETPVRIVCLHLSLGRADQEIQLAAVAETLNGSGAWAVAGDFNCTTRSAPLLAFCEATDGRIPTVSPPTFPAWRPRHDFDHIVAGGALELEDYRSGDADLSDHLPVAARGVLGRTAGIVRP